LLTSEEDRIRDQRFCLDIFESHRQKPTQTWSASRISEDTKLYRMIHRSHEVSPHYLIKPSDEEPLLGAGGRLYNPNSGKPWPLQEFGNRQTMCVFE
jgi:hypothetical protein